MLDLRFVILIFVLFAGALCGAGWMVRGMPVAGVRAAPPTAGPRALSFEEISRKDNADTRRQQWLEWRDQLLRDAHTAQSDGDPARDKLRAAVIEAATAFSLSPCNAAFKEQYLQAAAAYARAFTTLAGCPNYPACSGNAALIERAEPLFNAPADGRVRDAIRAVHDMGVSLKEYPEALGRAVAHLAKSGNWTDDAFSCTGPQASVAKPRPLPGPAPPPRRFIDAQPRPR